MLFAETGIESLPVATILMTLFGGLALFLYGLDKMSSALKQIAGEGLRKVLARLTTNRFSGALAGAVVTAVIQSSSVTTVLVVGFISAGLMSLAQSIGVIMGANIGTTVTAQLVAFKVTHYALLLVAVGFFLLFSFQNERIRQYGQAVMGLGLIFFGMFLMSDGTMPLRTYEPFIVVMQRMDNPFLAIALAAAFTALVQSSSATTGLVITMAAQGFITLEAGIALAFGANIGTCVTAALAALGKPRDAIRAALVHVVFNVAGVAVWFAFIPQLAEWVTWLSPRADDLSGAARLAAETPRQIANAHTVFNLSNTVLFIWFTTPLAWIIRKIVPERAAADEPAKAKYLDDVLLQTPALALDAVLMELGRLGDAALEMLRMAYPTVVRGSELALDRMESLDDDVDALHAAIVTYLGQLSQSNLSDHQSKQLQTYLAAANHIESIGDMIETNLVEVGRERHAADLRVSQATEQVLGDLNASVLRATEDVIRALTAGDRALAADVADRKDEINRLADEVETHLSSRLAATEPNRLAMYRLESELREYLKRIYYFTKRIAKHASE